jgi:DNA-binding CsgD family transcriptional regulator
MVRNPLQIVEAAYDLEATNEAWLRETVTALGRVVSGIHPHGFFIDLADKPIIGEAVVNSDRLTVEDLRQFHADASIDEVSRAYRGSVSTLSDAFGSAWATLPLAREFRRSYGALDGLGVIALDAERRGCVLGLMLPRVTHLDERARQALGCVTAHVAAANRLRRGVRVDEAVLTPDGVMLDGSSEVNSRSKREVLRRYARAIDRARCSRERDFEEALALWPALLEGRYSLVDRFESDGKHFVIVHKNEPHAPGSPSLTDRERQVVALAALGRTNKLIAYELGLTPATVAMHLGRAMVKLNIRRRGELTHVYRLLRDA